ncbi:lamin tail domain-containing protein [Candidatus Falkowbacteria bacterium]|nr:lamin tail domain-containing protein [Candidatus Falkowbacteria bacterium]
MNNKTPKSSKAKKTLKSHGPERHSWLKKFSIAGEDFTINFSFKQKPPKEANKSYLFKHRKEIKGGLAYGGQAFAAVVLLTVIVSMLSWSALIWNKSVQDRYRPIQLLRSTLGNFGQLAMDTISGQNDASASSTSPSIFSLIAEGVKKEIGSLASGVKKQITKISPPKNETKVPVSPPPAAPVASSAPIAVAPVKIEPPTPVKKAVPTTTPVVKKPEPVKTVVPTTTPVVKATTTPATTTTPVVKAPEPEQQQTVVKYVINEAPVYPETSITASPASLTSSTAATFAYSSNKSVVVYEYKLDNGTWISAGNTVSLSGLSEGNHVFMARSTDSVGPDPTPVQYDWRIDLTPPAIVFVSAPASSTNQTTAAFEFGANELATYHYKLDSEAWQQSVGATTSFSGLSEGFHELSAYGVDTLGFQGATIEANWLVDLLPPTAYLNEVPQTTSLEDYSVNGLNVSFGGSDQNMPNGSGIFSYDVEYAIDGGAWQQWNQALEQDYAVFGQQMSENQVVNFRVRAHDGAGNLGDWGDTSQTRFASTRPSNLVLSEVQITGDSATDEFIELYNPTDDAITLDTSVFVLSFKNSAGNETILVDDFMNMQIDAHGYVLVASADYSGGATPDISYPPTSEVPANATVIISQSGQAIDRLGFGTAQEFELEPFADNPGPYESLERKAAGTSTAGTMVNGATHHLSGNGYDSNSNAEDFVLKIQSEPQNVDSGTELAYGSGIDFRFAMSGAASFFGGVWFSLAKSWINPARLESLNGFIDNAINDLVSEVVAAQLVFDSFDYQWQDFSTRLVRGIINKT